MRQIFVLLSLLFVSHIAKADFYLEFGLENGGKTLISAERSDDFYYSFDQDLNIGGGGKIAIGIRNAMGDNSDRSLMLSLGYLRDSIDATNGDAEYDAVTIDAIYSFHFDSHSLGIGASYHYGPEYREDIDGFPSLSLEFDDAPGLILQYGYSFPPFQVGLRYTEMDYEVNDFTLDASSAGIFIAYTRF